MWDWGKCANFCIPFYGLADGSAPCRETIGEAAPDWFDIVLYGGMAVVIAFPVRYIAFHIANALIKKYFPEIKLKKRKKSSKQSHQNVVLHIYIFSRLPDCSKVSDLDREELRYVGVT